MHKQVHRNFLFYYVLNKITPSLFFYSNFCIALYNLYMHSSLTNQKRDILVGYVINRLIIERSDPRTYSVAGQFKQLSLIECFHSRDQ